MSNRDECRLTIYLCSCLVYQVCSSETELYIQGAEGKIKKQKKQKSKNQYLHVNILTAESGFPRHETADNISKELPGFLTVPYF